MGSGVQGAPGLSGRVLFHKLNLLCKRLQSFCFYEVFVKHHPPSIVYGKVCALPVRVRGRRINQGVFTNREPKLFKEKSPAFVALLDRPSNY